MRGARRCVCVVCESRNMIDGDHNDNHNHGLPVMQGHSNHDYHNAISRS